MAARRILVSMAMVLAAAAVGACTGASSSRPHAAAASAPAPWYLGADVSGLTGGRRGNYQENGVPGSEISIMKAHGWNAFRLRVFVSPVRRAPNNSLENTIELAKQIKAAGGTFLLDIHYSDTWADPQHQETPVAWREGEMPSKDPAVLEKQVEDIEKHVAEHTKEVITQLKAAGAMPEMVQVGNEITGGMLWPLGHVKVPSSSVKTDAGAIQPLPDPYDDAAQWDHFTRFLKAGVKAVREASGDTQPKIVIHIDCGGDWPITQWFFDHLQNAGVVYDIIGQSYYPRYHGTLSGLQENVLASRKRFGKPTMVVETGYPQGGRLTPPYMTWPASQQGQLQFMADLVNTAKRVGCLGVFYWAPEGSGGNGMWNRDGSPAPSIFVMDQLQTLTTRPASQLPDPPRR